MLSPLIQPFHDILYDFKDYWHFRAFDHCTLNEAYPWEEKSPALAQAIRRFSLEDWQRFEEQEQTHQLIDLITQFEPSFQRLSSLSLIHFTEANLDLFHDKQASKALQSAQPQGMKQRKADQIEALLPYMANIKSNQSVLEWCGGKGHLSRLLLRQGLAQKLTVIDWDHALIDEGKRLSEGLMIDFYQVNALSQEGRDFLYTHPYVLAIHACGSLHRCVIEESQIDQQQGLWIAPCCYHLDTIEHYHPMSQAVKALEKKASFPLDRYLLRLATQQRTHGSERRHQLRQRAAAFRLGFQSLIKEELKLPLDMHFPSLSRAALRQDFKGVCQSFAQFIPHCQQSLLCLSQKGFDHYEALGYQQLLYMLPVEHIRHLFRHILEHWLCFDRAIALEEKGFDTQIHAFCDISMTPRNLLITAKA